MRIKVKLYADEGTKVLERAIDIPSDQWREMNFLDKEAACKKAVESSFYWYWRECEKNEA